MNVKDCAAEQNTHKKKKIFLFHLVHNIYVEELGVPQSEEEYTWKHRQPSRVVSIADRVPCQTSVLARILKRHIGQEENL